MSWLVGPGTASAPLLPGYQFRTEIEGSWMSDGEPYENTTRFQVSATAESHFSWLRTRMSLERTLMSWVRTATALIGFGFTIFQFLHRFNQTPGVEAPEYPWAPWFLGLGLIGTGLVALIISVWEYRSLVRYLWEKDFK